MSRVDWYGFVGLVEILVLAFVFYSVFRFLRGTRSAQVLTGLVLGFLFLFAATDLFQMDELNWLLRKLSVYLVLAFFIIFQPEIRRALAELGKARVFSSGSEARSIVDQVVQAVSLLAERRIGALIAIECEIGTRSMQETGVKLDCKMDASLLATMFFPHTPLHDGGVVIRGDRIVAAGCLFPLSERMGMKNELGTRHRAAIGMTEETDAVVVVVSEETGVVSACHRGRLTQDLDADRLRKFLARTLVRGRDVRSSWERAKAHLDLSPEGIARSDELAKQEGPDEDE